MRLLFISLCALLLWVPCSGSAAPLSNALLPDASIEQQLERAMEESLVSGAVVIVGNRSGILATAVRGNLTTAPQSPPLTTESIFDLASLTKVVATAPAVMLLAEQGKVDIHAPIVRWFPEFRGSTREELTPFQLLTHTSGLNDVAVTGERQMEATIRKAALQKPFIRPGSRFRYADINFILLGELVRRVSGYSLAEFCRRELYGPLGLERTMFLPPPALFSQIAPTCGTNSGTVQDHNARRLGGIAGHAGLFCSASDLARYARMILGGGEIDGQRILAEETVIRMTTGYHLAGGVIRTPGWDSSSPYSAPRGPFLSDRSFGHTGYSGSSIWIDPSNDLFVIMLTNRINYSNPSLINRLRRNVSAIAAARFGLPFSVPELNPEQLLRELTFEAAHSSPGRESRSFRPHSPRSRMRVASGVRHKIVRSS